MTPADGLVEVTTWTANRRHLADMATAQFFDHGLFHVRTLCDRKSTTAGRRVVNESGRGGRIIEQSEIDGLPLCATCERRSRA